MPFTTLMYHEIRESRMYQFGQPSPIDVRQDYEDYLPPPLFVTLENFLHQMNYLYENKYHTLTLDEVLNFYYKGKKLPDKSVLLTFDDCYQSLGLYAYPILKKYRFHAVAFVVTGWLNADQKSFNPNKSICHTANDLNEMMDVFEYANHTDLFHTKINSSVSIMMESSDLAFSDDLDRCNANPIIQAKDVFAYPFGLYTERNVDLLRYKGFRLAFTTKGGKNDKNDTPLLLKRNVIPYSMEFNTFLNLLEI